MKNPNLRTINYQIPKSLDGITIEAFLRKKGYSKRIISHLKTIEFTEDGSCLYGIMLNGAHGITPQKILGGDQLTIHLLETEESEFVPEASIPLDIVYEDEDLWIINKPPGLPIHPSKGHYEDSLGNALCYYAHHHLHKDKFIYRVINRLDRDTSGLLISAKNMLSAGVLGDAITKREIHREYYGICRGNPLDILNALPPGVSICPFPEYGTSISKKAIPAESSLLISAPILDEEDVAMKRRVDFENGDDAKTHMQLLSYDEEQNISLIRLKLETGRTHQIRVHMLYLGHPLIGDFLYNPDSSLMNRQALHSRSLVFTHPISGKAMHFETPLPEDMKRLFPDF